MVNYKNKNKWKSKAKKGEVIFSNHKLEFIRFFNAHKKICDEISGLKYHVIGTVHGDERKVITKKNFNVGINKLRSFVTDYFYNIDDKGQGEELNRMIGKLEDSFNNDVVYKSFIAKGDNIGITQEVMFNKLYLKYLLQSFEITYYMSIYLQKSLNLSSKEIIKTVAFVDYDSFFNNLSHYRDETVSVLSNLSYINLYDNFKKILGYYYTYRYLLDIESNNLIKKSIFLLYGYITDENTIKRIIRIKGGGDISKDYLYMVNKDFQIIKDLFNWIYNICNKGLKNKNILPKTKVRLMEDNTLI